MASASATNPVSLPPNPHKLKAKAFTQPISSLRLKQIATDACDSTLEKVEGYNHSGTESWNTQIINRILQTLISETSGSSQPAYKYAVNSTIIQHLSDPAPRTTSIAAKPGISLGTQTTSDAEGESGAETGDKSVTAAGDNEEYPMSGSGGTARSTSLDRTNAMQTESKAERKIGRRGVHSAIGAYWNNEKDGMWSFKYEGAEDKGMDIVISVIWMSID